ncbi:uncharacterized protein JCM15063_005413 [Sporobolomyces koalae]|uniref:uncharacterized protein n=1 Tax=Sporobolomyces koalae TaxID=500713 RepID=UPI0031810F8C
MSATGPLEAPLAVLPAPKDQMSTSIVRSVVDLVASAPDEKGSTPPLDEGLSTAKPSPPPLSSNGVAELLQKALTLKDGGEPAEAREGERTPGKASTDLTAVERIRTSPTESAASQRGDSSSQPSVSRNNSLPSHQHHRITPPQGWHSISPTASSDGTNYPLSLNSLRQGYHPTYPYSSPQGGGTGHGRSGPEHPTAKPPFLAGQPRHPSQISQVSQISDQSAGYSTGSPYSSSSSLWYQQYASAVTTPSSYPGPLEGGIPFANDTSPEACPDVGSPQGMLSGYVHDAPPYPAAQHYNEPLSHPASPPHPYQPVYFAAPAQRSHYAPLPNAQAPSNAYTDVPGYSGVGRHQNQIAYPISSAPVLAHIGHTAEHVGANQMSYIARHEEPSWRQASQQTLVPSYPYQPYTPYPQAWPASQQHTRDNRRPQPVNQSGLQTHNSGSNHVAQFTPNAYRPFRPPPAIPPRPGASVPLPPKTVSPQSTSIPKVYSPPKEVSRGMLASTRLREAARAQGAKPARATRDPKGRVAPKKGNLPKPPAHSPFALWVGNVPSDASHSELWQFFVTRPSPHAMGIISSDNIDLDTPGVESIHLIARSNCAFVNYVSEIHLRHAITVANGLSLRPNDPRCKTLLCRVRKEEDESKTGVGAQRVGGIHKAFVKLQRERMNEAEQILRLKIDEQGSEPKSSATKAFEKRRESSSSVSAGTTSTNSSFFAKHFEKRWFIMKSHDEADLKLSVESGLWATQPHNEPVLQQAFRTAKDVYLVFSANGSGEWYGYARMSGPIASVASGKGSRPSWGSSGPISAGDSSVSSTSLSIPSQTIQEDAEDAEPNSFPSSGTILLTPSEHRLTQASPASLSPSTAPLSNREAEHRHGGSYPIKLPSEINAEARQEMALEQELMAFVTARNLHLPPEVAEAARKAATYDSGTAAKKNRAANEEVPPGTLRDAIRRIDTLTGEEEVVRTDHDDGRKPARSGSSSTWGTPFAVEWIKVTRLPFVRTRHIRNSFNGNREIKVSRDGTEVEPAAGQALIDEFDQSQDATKPEHSPASSAGMPIPPP